MKIHPSAPSIIPPSAEAITDQQRFAQLAPRLIASGYEPIPIEGKACLIPGWPTLDPQTWVGDVKLAQHGVGLRMGQQIALDLDIYDEALAEAADALVVKHLGEAPLRVGRWPKRARLYRRQGGSPSTVTTGLWRLPADSPGFKGHQVELLIAGRQLAAFGIHPETKRPYEWRGPSPLDIAAKDLPPFIESRWLDLRLALIRLLEERGASEIEPPKGPDGRPVRGRNDHLYKRGCALRAVGLEEDEILDRLRREQGQLVEERHPLFVEGLLKERELRQIAHSAAKHAPGKIEPEGGEPFPLEIVLGAEAFLAKPIPPREEIVKGLIRSQDLVMLYAARGVGKTQVALSLAACINTSRDFMKWEVPKPRRVLFVDGEMAAADLQERLRGWTGGSAPMLDVLSSEAFYAMQERPMNLAGAEDQARFFATLDALAAAGRKPEVIILDNKSALMAGVDENSNSEQDGFLAFIRALRHLGFTVIIVHHAGKSGDQRGASRNEDLLDLVIKLALPDSLEDGEEPAEGARFVMSFTKHRARRPKPAKLDVEMIAEMDGSYEWAVKEPQGMASHVKVGLYLLDHPAASRADIAEATGLTKNNVTKKIGTLRSKGWLADDGLDLSQKGRAYFEAVAKKIRREDVA